MKHDVSTDTAAWWLIAAMACSCLLACRGMGFVIDPLRAVAPGLAVSVLLLTMILARKQGRLRLACGATAFLQMTLFTIIGVVLAYLFASRGHALWDGALAAADVRLGLDWPAIFRGADRWPIALWIGGLAYHSLTLQMVICIVALSATGRTEALRLAVAAAITSGFATIVISGLMPAMGNLFDPANYHHLWSSVAWSERDLIANLRNGSDKVLDLSHLMGIVTFPSYHATLPVILAWGQRDVPRLRVIAPLCAAVTIVATPLFGGHYGVDILAGLALAVVAIATARLLVMRGVPSSSVRALTPP